MTFNELFNLSEVFTLEIWEETNQEDERRVLRHAEVIDAHRSNDGSCYDGMTVKVWGDTGTRTIPDPANITREQADQLAMRYHPDEPTIVSHDRYAERYSAMCDAICRILWPDKYGIEPGDGVRHTSDAARKLANVFMEAAGVAPGAVLPVVPVYRCPSCKGRVLYMQADDYYICMNDECDRRIVDSAEVIEA